MRLHKLSYINRRTGWNIKDLQFGSLSLFVGASGVGKTQILRAILDLCGIAAGRSMNGVDWSLEFEEEGVNYEWSGEFEIDHSDDDNLLGEVSNNAITSEILIVKDTGDTIFKREQSTLLYNGEPTVKLNPSISAIELLKEEADVAPINEGFHKITLLDMSNAVGRAFGRILKDIDKLEVSLSDIRKSRQYSILDRLYLIKTNNPEIFLEIQDNFREVFPLVEQIDFDIHRLGENRFVPTLKIKEENVDAWIDQRNISSGMLRTLAQIISLALAEDGDVILIDEFENGLGVNCIEDLAEMAIDADKKVQIIMTSHHPYIINSIPYKNWRIVLRSGSDVTVKTATELGIGEGSKHKAFMQLIQTNEYMTGKA